MNREELIPKLQARGLEVNTLQREEHSISVFQGKYQNDPVAIQVLVLPKDGDYTQLEQECNIMVSLSHPNILKLHGWFWEHNEVSSFFVMVTEWCDKDLVKDMKQRTENSYPWEEVELWNLIFGLVSALACMQEQGISHRNIKPESIFLTLSRNVKLGDFGSARTFQSDTAFATVIGTPFYLSPKLREAFIQRNLKVGHNSFKSDVFSLGLTLLTLIQLGPVRSLAKSPLSDEDVQTVLNTVPCSVLLQTILSWMLAVDEKVRCDFKDLNDYLTKNPPRTSLGVSLHEVVSEQVMPPKIEESCVPYTIVPETTHPEEPSSPPKQEEVVPMRKIIREIICLQCRKLVDPSSETAKCDVVQLYCNPMEHMFCSRECCKEFLDLGRFCCPQCDVEIPSETIVFYQSKLSISLSEGQQSIGSLAVPKYTAPLVLRTDDIELKTQQEILNTKRNHEKGDEGRDPQVKGCHCVCW